MGAYAEALAAEEPKAPGHDPRSHFLGAGAETLAFFLTLDTVNFGSGYFPHLRKNPGQSGYFTIATRLRERFEEKGPFEAEELEALRPADCASLFGQDLSNPACGELMSLFALALGGLGALLKKRYAGRFEGIVEEAGGSAEALAGVLSRMPFFRDVEMYRGFPVPFYKRAQISAADLHIAFDGAGWGAFHDLDDLTLFADNLVPHVLRIDGLLAFEPDLVQRIEAEGNIPLGSAEEVEIRASALWAVELLVRELRSRGIGATAWEMDNRLWNRGRVTRYKSRPRHRTRCTFY
jgi:hypothetical protein